MRVSHVITRLIVGGAQENTVATVLGLLRKPGVQVHEDNIRMRDSGHRHRYLATRCLPDDFDSGR